jgi:hypothetical protein
MRKTMGFLVGALATTTLLVAAAQQPAQPLRSFFEEAKITVSARARADGYLRVRVQPENGEAREATIDVPRRTSENDIAKSLTAALGAVIGNDYEVDRDAGEHVKIRKARRDAANFSVEITFSAPGFSIILDN